MNSSDDPNIPAPTNHVPSVYTDAPPDTDADLLETWMIAAGIEGNDSPFSRRIIRTVGEFLTKVGQLPNSPACEIIADVDFTSSVTIVQLPASSFIKSDAFEGMWLTDTGLAPDSIRSTPFPRRRRILYCASVVPALKATSKSVREPVSRDQLFTGVPPMPPIAGQRSATSAGTQYIVVNQQMLRDL